MSWVKAREALDMIKVAIDGLEAIERLTHIGGPKAEAALAATRAAVVALREGFDGKTSPQVVLAQIESLHDDLAKNDAEALAALHDKFKVPETP
jgi:hypothetical protein